MSSYGHRIVGGATSITHTLTHFIVHITHWMTPECELAPTDLGQAAAESTGISREAYTGTGSISGAGG